MMVWIKIFQSGFFNAGICEADKQESLSVFFRSGSRTNVIDNIGYILYNDYEE